VNRSQERQGYLIALIGVLLVLAARLSVRQALDEQSVLLPFVLAVMAAAWRGGLVPGLAATAMGLALGVLFLMPSPQSVWVEIDHGMTALIFVLIGVTISVLCEALHESRRRETEKQFRTLADSIPQLVWMARPDGSRRWLNRQWTEYTGVHTADLLDWGWKTLHNPEALPRILEHWQAALASGEPWEDTVQLRRRDGQMRWHLARALPLRNAEGEIESWFGTHTDITERLEAEHALQVADRRKDEFLAVLAHELRNPLSSLGHIVELWPIVRDDREEMEQMRLVLQRQVQQMTRLIEDLMDVSRIGRGKAVLRKEHIDVRPLLRRAAEETQLLFESRGQHLADDLAGEPLIVDGDPARLTQVFGNLLNNAAKYTPPGGTIWITARLEAGQVVVRVRDTGAGIPPGKLNEIFEMFAQVDRTLERADGGLGIGLSLVRRLVELHGGTVEATSAGVDQGSEFIVRLAQVEPQIVACEAAEVPACLAI